MMLCNQRIRCDILIAHSLPQWFIANHVPAPSIDSFFNKFIISCNKQVAYTEIFTYNVCMDSYTQNSICMINHFSHIHCNKKCPILAYITQGLHVKSDIFIFNIIV